MTSLAVSKVYAAALLMLYTLFLYRRQMILTSVWMITIITEMLVWNTLKYIKIAEKEW